MHQPRTYFASTASRSVALLLLLLLPLLGWGQITLSTSVSSYSENFDLIGTTAPTGFSTVTGATATALGTSVAYVTAPTAWNNVSGNFRNVASADGLSSAASATTQNASGDRSIALRQTNGFGNPGGAFVFQLANTTNISGLSATFKLQSLDATSGQTTAYRVDYRVGTTGNFTAVTPTSGSTTVVGSAFSNSNVTVNFGTALNNSADAVYIRIVALASSTGSGNRATTGLDDFVLNYTASAPVADTTPPAFVGTSPTVGTTTTSGFTLSSTLNEAGTTYYVVVADGAAAPTVAQVRAGQNAASTAALASGSFANTANTAATAVINTLSAGTAYDVYVVAQDAVTPTPNVQAAVTGALDVTTLTPAATIATGAIAPASVLAGNDVTVNFTTTGSFNAANVFTAVLSNPTGNFTNGTTLTTTASTATSLTVTIPVNTAAGSGYLIRVVASNPATTGSNSTNTLTVTVPLTAPTGVSTTAASAITQNSATSGGTVTADGGSTITARGVVYGISASPRLNGSGVMSVADGAPGTGTFTSALTGLASSTQYYVAAYATNSVGTTYGADELFTTSGATSGGPLLAYTFPTTNSTSPTTQATGVTGSVFSRATSLNSTQNEPDFRSTGFPSSTASPAAGATTGYYQFTLTLAAGSSANLTSLVVSDRSSGTGPTRWEVRTSLDGYAARVGAQQTNPTTTLTPRTVDLTGTSALSNVVGTVTFRIYAYGSSNSSTGTFAVDDVNLYGTLSASAPIAAEPTAQPTVTATATTTTTVQLTLSGGDGAKRLVVIRPAAALAAAPVDGVTYTANAAYGTTGTGTTTSTNNYVVIADGTTTSLTVTGLAAGTAYTVEAYAYNDNATAGRENYLSAAPGAATFTTLTPPAQTYAWNGTGTSYSSPGSWTPARTATAITDNLVFDGATTSAANITLDFASPETVASITLQGGVVVTFSTDANRTLTLSGAAVPANLVVGATDSLRLLNTVANQGLTLQFAADATARIDGGIAADGTAFSSGTTHRILGTSATPNAIVFRTGSAITATGNFGGNLFGSAAGYAGTVLFESGSTYFQQGGSSPFGGAGANASVAFQSGSYYRYLPATASSPSFSGRTYGNFIYNPGFPNAPVTTGGNLLLIQNDLRVLSGSLSLDLTGGITIKGDVLVNGSATLGFDPAGTTAGPLQLAGTAPQVIGGTNTSAAALTLGSNVTLQINNSQGVTLQRPLTLPGTLQLTSGTLSTMGTNVLDLTDAATLTGGSATSFVNGPVGRLVPGSAASTSYTFPIGRLSGTTGNYRPLTLNIASQGGTATLYRAEQKDGDPGQTGTVPTATDGTTLTRVSRVRSFSLTPYDPASPAIVAQPAGFSGTVTLSFGTDDIANLPGALVIAKRSTSTQPWANIGRTSNTGSTVTSGTFSSFSDFALASTDADLANNPLPVQLSSFGARRQAARAVAVKWTTATEKNAAYFEVQRSLNTRDFVTVATVQANGTSSSTTAYATLDEAAPVAALYYRLRQVDHDGKVAFSPMVSIVGSGEAAKVLLYPNPTSGALHFIAETATPYRVLNQLGQALLQGTTEAGTAKVTVEALPAGLYFLELTATGRSMQKFEKQ